ncbi:glycerate dehydrogenase [bacterium]|nr:glycerate dehydrogenase [bacterium]
MPKLKTIYLLNESAFDVIYGPDERRDVAELVDVIAPLQTVRSVADDPTVLADVEVILSGWGMPTMDEAFLVAAPNLKAVFYGAGSIKKIVTDAFWARQIPITSAYAANAVPVIEYALAQILLSLKRTWHYMFAIREQQQYIPRTPVPGAYGSTVGLISLGMIGSGVAEKLQQFDVHVIAYDPFIRPERAAELGVELCSLEELFHCADVVSLHAPWLDETVGMIQRDHFVAMKQDATFINTARGAIVREDEMIAVLQDRPDLWAILDVTYPEPPVPGSPLYTLPNVVLTPHIAGSLDNECRRMGRLAVEDLRKFVNGEGLTWAISREQAAIMA